jgi:hypothetical protein
MLPASPRCTHVKGHSGVKSAQRQVQAGLATNRFVLRTDVKSYYASIDHVLLMDRLAQFIRDRTIHNLCRQYLKRTACSLSPRFGALFLGGLDTRMAKSGLCYVRFMDDILVLAPARSKLRGAVRAVNAVLAALRKASGQNIHRQDREGLDFLSYRFGERVLELAEATIERFVEQATRLFDQGRSERVKALLLGRYVRRWLPACSAG